LTALLLARMAHNEARCQAAIAAALTMNFAMLELQSELYRAQGPLTDAQRTQLREHPRAGEQMLRTRGVDDPVWLQIVAQHHEALDGSGYPLGIKGDAICREAQVIALADRYCGMVSERAYRAGLAPGVALKEIHGKHGAVLDPVLIGIMVKAFGLYPPGTLVTLVNKEVGIVTKRLIDVKHPVVHTLFQDPRRPYDTPRKRMTASQPQYEILSVVARSEVACPIDPQQLWPRSVSEDPSGAANDATAPRT